ncbi:unnamed protein product, partial [Meganyctiphanes norvegica]
VTMYHLLAAAAVLLPATAIAAVTPGYYDMDFCYCDLDPYLQEVQETLKTNISSFYDTNTSIADATTLPSDRKKRSASNSIDSNYRGKVFWPSTSQLRNDLEFSNTKGVMYKNFSATEAEAYNCSCEPGSSIIEMRMCLLNLDYNNVSDSASADYAAISLKVMKELYLILRNGMKKENLFRRVQFLGFEAEGDKAAVLTQVDLTEDETYKAAFQVESSIEPK